MPDRPPVLLSVVLWHAAFDARRRARRIEIERKLGGAAHLTSQGVRYAVSSDTYGMGCWPSWRQAAIVSLRNADATHHLVLADDMLPCVGFIASAQRAIAAIPDHPINFFAMRQSADQAKAQGLHWIVSPDGLWGGSHVLPTALLRDFLAWEKAHVRPTYPWDDRRVQWYCIERGIKIYQTAPSLLSHVEAGTSLLGNANRTRVVRWFVDDGSVVDIDWTLGKTIKEAGHQSLKMLSEAMAL